MNFRHLLLTTVVGMFAFVPSVSFGNQSGALSSLSTTTQTVVVQRQRIERLPLVRRPNRPGHFIGNNIRRLHYGTVFVNQRRGVRGPLGF